MPKGKFARKKTKNTVEIDVTTDPDYASPRTAEMDAQREWRLRATPNWTPPSTYAPPPERRRGLIIFDTTADSFVACCFSCPRTRLVPRDGPMSTPDLVDLLVAGWRHTHGGDVARWQCPTCLRGT